MTLFEQLTSTRDIYLLPINSVELLHWELQDLRDLIQECFETPGISTVQDDGAPKSTFPILNQSDFLGYSGAMVSERCGIIFQLALLSRSPHGAGGATVPWWGRPVSPRGDADGLHVLLVRAQVAPSILQLVQLTDAMYSSWGGDGPDPEWQRDPMGEVIHERVEALEAPLVDGHLDSCKLRVSTLEECYFFGWRDLGEGAGPSHRGEGRLIVVGAGV